MIYNQWVGTTNRFLILCHPLFTTTSAPVIHWVIIQHATGIFIEHIWTRPLHLYCQKHQILVDYIHSFNSFYILIIYLKKCKIKGTLTCSGEFLCTFSRALSL